MHINQKAAHVKAIRAATGMGLRESLGALKRYGSAMAAIGALAKPIDRDAFEDAGRIRIAAPKLLEALRRIAAIENKMAGLDWDEINEARAIAKQAIFDATGEQS